MERKLDKKLYENYAYTLDYLPQGHPEDFGKPRRPHPLVQVLGEKYFLLLELVALEEVPIEPGEKLFIGKGFRSKIKYVKGIIDFERLTSQAKYQLPLIVEKIVKDQEERFVNFFNEAKPITKRLNELELLPGVGKKLMWNILEEKKIKPYASFSDISTRTRLKNPEKAVIKRILEELKGDSKYYLFVFKPKHAPWS